MVEGVDQRQGRSAVEGASVIEGGGDADRGLVDVRDAEIDFSHDGRGFVSIHGHRVRRRSEDAIGAFRREGQCPR